MSDRDTAAWVRRIILILLLGGLIALSFVVLRHFLVPALWAAILAYVTWPLHARLCRQLGGRAGWSALLSTLLLTLLLGIPLVWLIVLLREELVGTWRELTALAQHGDLSLPPSVAGIPWLGEWLQEMLSLIMGEPAALRARPAQLGERWGGRVAGVVGDAGLNALLVTVTLFTAFFFYRDGESLVAQLRRVLESFLGPRVGGYLGAVGETTRAVVFGLFLAALAQGALAGLAYWVAGVRAPVFWGAITAILALIPFGAPLIWGSIGVWLLLTGETAAGFGVLAWGALVVSWIDNLVRPLVISGSTQIPFLLVLFGVFGGLGAFGLIGLFVGPVILAVLLAVWREWLEENAPGLGNPPPP
jgi:predicted PurR-regulated permease PerM